MQVHLGHFGVALALGALLATPSLHAQERFTLTGSEVTIHNLAGALQIMPASGSSTEVEVTRIGRDAVQLRLVPGTTGGASTFRVIYPGDEIIYPPMGERSQTTLSVSDDGTFGRSNSGTRSVRISGSDRASAGALEAAADIVVRIPVGVRLTTHVAVGNAQLRGVRGAVSVNTSSGGITASGARGELALRTASGTIEARDIDAALTVRTASGGVKITDARGSAINVHVASGSIDAAQLRAPSVELRTSSGKIRADDIQTERLILNSASGSVAARSIATGEAQVRTASGGIELDLTAPVQVAELRTASGTINLRVPQNMGATLTLRSGSGGIQVNAPMTVTSQRRGYTAGTIGDGSSQVSASTSSGSVVVSAR